MSDSEKVNQTPRESTEETETPLEDFFRGAFQAIRGASNPQSQQEAVEDFLRNHLKAMGAYPEEKPDSQTPTSEE
jgi:hypothetical protein